MKKFKKKGFTLIELIAVLVIMAIIALIVTPLVMSIIRKAKISARKRSVDAYGRSVELAIASYLMDTGTFPTNEQLPNLQVEYSGSNVVCSVMAMKENGGLYLSECKVNNVEVKDSKTEDGWYHYGTRDLTNEEYVDMYGDALKKASLAYFNTNGNPVEDYTTLTIDYKGKPVSCDITINYDGTIYMTKCKVTNVDVTSDTEEDGYYHYGSIVYPLAVQSLLAKTNPVSITNYTDGNTGEMYTFEHPATEQTGALTDYRYIGANPNNYVTFNNELWRIIGVFTVEDENGNTEQRIKLVRNEKLSSDMKWNSNNKNAWSIATLNTYLNGDYYNGIEATSKSMIADTKYYLGGGAYDSTTHFGTASDIYTWERGTTVYSGRSTSWNGKISLMYPSDYTYTYALGVDNTCYTDGAKCSTDNGGAPTKGWIYNTNSNSFQWLLSPRSGDSNNVFLLGSSGHVSFSNSKYSNGVRPSLYLVSNIKIDSGEGTEQSPYHLSM